MGFWKWYYKGILKVPRALISPWGEFVWAVLIFVFLSIFLCVAFSPFYIFLTASVSVTMVAHAYWRDEVRKEARRVKSKPVVSIS